MKTMRADKKMDRKVLWSRVWTGSIIAALAAAIGIFAVMLQMEKKMLSEYERGGIYVASREIPKGERITSRNYRDYLCLKEVDKGVIPATALAEPGQLEGLIARVSIAEGTLLTTGMFEEQQEIFARMEEPVIAGFKADDLYQGAGGVLRAGDRIHIYTVSESGIAHLIWREIFVEQVFDSAGNAIGGGDSLSSAQRVNVYLDAGDVEQFYTELARGTLRVVKVCE
ncbi:MAG: SAF domain-containing protein [Acetatifactor sp.]|nr:SAF domain-containing protein [Acetatifactor sp.]